MLQPHRGGATAPPENTTAYEDYLAEGQGEAAYVTTMLVIYAVSIGFMIGYLSFKKNKYRQWDREANQYLNSYYKRQIKHEKTRLQTFADKFNPGMTVLFATGLAMGNLGRPRTLSSASDIAVARGPATGLQAEASAAAAAAAASVTPGRRASRERRALSEIVEEEDDDVSIGMGGLRDDSRSRLLLTEAEVAGSSPGSQSQLPSQLYEVV